MAKILGIDFGEKRIGLALCTEDQKFAYAYETLAWDKSFFSRLQDICQLEKVEKFVVGLPLGLSGRETAQTQSVRRFAAQLQKRINLPVEWQDERLTSKMTMTLFREAKIKKSKQKIDQASARIILQDYLDKHSIL